MKLTQKLLRVWLGKQSKTGTGFPSVPLLFSSSLKGTLPAGKSETITNWRDSGLNLMIKVNEIDTNATPSYASVEITFGPEN